MLKEKRFVPEIRFPEFTREWKKTTLNEIVGYTKGYAFKSHTYTSKGVRIIRVSDLGSDRIKSNNGKIFISKENSIGLEKYLINKDDIIITTVGSNPKMTDSAVGRGIFVYKENEGLLNQNLLKFELPDFIISKFLYSFLNSPKYIHYIKGIKRGNANQSNITVSELLEYSISIAPYKEQQKIANFLTAIDNRIQILEKKKSLLEEYKKGVMQKIFKQEMRFKDDTGKKFPEWRERKLSDFLILTLREVPKPKDHYLAIGIRSHGKGTFQKPNFDPSKISMEKLFLVKENDLIVNITFAWEGAIAIVKSEDTGGHVSHRFPTYTFNRDIAIHEFFQYVIINKRFKQILDLISPGGAGRNRVMSKKEFIKIKWKIPSVKEQIKIAKFLSAIDKRIGLMSEKLEYSKTYKKGLLQQMFV